MLEGAQFPSRWRAMWSRSPPPVATRLALTRCGVRVLRSPPGNARLSLSSSTAEDTWFSPRRRGFESHWGRSFFRKCSIVIEAYCRRGVQREHASLVKRRCRFDSCRRLFLQQHSARIGPTTLSERESFAERCCAPRVRKAARRPRKAEVPVRFRVGALFCLTTSRRGPCW